MKLTLAFLAVLMAGCATMREVEKSIHRDVVYFKQKREHDEMYKEHQKKKVAQKREQSKSE